LSDAYANIGDSVTPENRQGIDNLYRACELCGVEAKTVAMRGGTDGSFISTKGILPPNYFTGAHNFHSNCEFLPMKSWEKSLEVTLALVALAAGVEH
ncbi:MAG: peptidase T, partial [Sutterella sp.]|nr:peptidase T [Sutterella sp.]